MSIPAGFEQMTFEQVLGQCIGLLQPADRALAIRVVDAVGGLVQEAYELGYKHRDEGVRPEKALCQRVIGELE